MKAFDVAEVKNLDPDDFTLYQISRSKKYDSELVIEEAERRGIEKGIEKGIQSLIANSDFDDMRIALLMNVSREYVASIRKKMKENS